MKRKYEIDELANLVPMATPAELNALINDIKQNGQKEPVLIYNNKIVDGRNRQKACEYLGIGLIVKELDENLTREDVLKLVKSYTTRRSLTTTQLAMSAVNEINAINDLRETNPSVAKLSVKEAASKWAITKRMLERALFIYKQDAKMAQDLFNGKTVSVYDDLQDKTIVTDKISTVERILKHKTHKSRSTVLFDLEHEINLSNESAKYDIDYNDYLQDDEVRDHFWLLYSDTHEVPLLKRDIAMYLSKIGQLSEELETLKQQNKKTRVLFTVTTDNLAEDTE